MRLRRRHHPETDPIAEFRRLSADVVARMNTVGGSLAEFSAELDAAVTRLQTIADDTEKLAGETDDD